MTRKQATATVAELQSLTGLGHAEIGKELGAAGIEASTEQRAGRSVRVYPRRAALAVLQRGDLPRIREARERRDRALAGTIQLREQRTAGEVIPYDEFDPVLVGRSNSIRSAILAASRRYAPIVAQINAEGLDEPTRARRVLAELAPLFAQLDSVHAEALPWAK
jgi:hypothetical protein